ncbi:MAG: carboxypeptidase regulatory-like domain-containing protein [Methanocella sp.]
MKLTTIIKIIAMIALALTVLPALSFATNVTVTGTVTDVNGDPVSGADVTLVDDSLDTLGVVRTDANGNFGFYNVSMNGSTIVKALVTYVHNGQSFSTRSENVIWIDVSQGLVTIPVNDTRLYNYPLSDHGYIWGTVIESLANSRALSATVYLDGNDVHRSVQTGSSGTFQIEVPPGEYKIYAVQEADHNGLFSNRTTITVQPSNILLESAPIVLIADQKPSSSWGDIKTAPFALALVIGILMIVTGWSLLNRK